MSNLPYTGQLPNLVASTIVAYTTIFRPMPKIGLLQARQAGRQKSVRLAKICPMGVRLSGCIRPGRGVPPRCNILPAFINYQLIKFFDQFDLCQICHILQLPGHAEAVQSIPSHPIAKNLSHLEQI